jgi:Cys-tRNA(Pro)/Cys-tRNA(Cys) deacylase
MTPAIRVLVQADVDHGVHEYAHDPQSESYGLEAAEALGLDPAVVFKTLVASTGQELVAAVVPVCGQVDMKKLAAAIKAKRVEMADPKRVERTTGYVLGGISPLGQKKRLCTVVDASASQHATIYVSGGRRGLDLSLAPGDLIDLLDAIVAPIARLK